MELKEGMYVRYTRKMVNEYVAPRIAKIVDCSDDELVKIDNGQVILRSDIIDKPSFNLINLIKIGDYVNGHKCYEIKKKCVMTGYKCFATIFNKNEDFLYQTVYVNKIKSVVTKEQFDSMKYVTKGDK